MSVFIGNTCVDFINTTTNVVSKPYDSKIEYLEGDGLAYIDLNVIPSTETVVESVVQMANVTTTDYWPSVCGTRGLINNQELQRYTIRFSNDITATGYESGMFQKSAGPKINWLGGYGPYKTIALSKLKLSMNATGCYVENANGIVTRQTTFSVSNTGKFDRSLYLFNIHTTDEIIYTGSSGKNLRIFSFFLKEKDTILKLIPVRCGQIGYMYDEISGLLFGNKNTEGKFICGLDII